MGPLVFREHVYNNAAGYGSKRNLSSYDESTGTLYYIKTVCSKVEQDITSFLVNRVLHF